MAKVDPSGSSLVYATFLGGTNGDEARSVAVDGAGNAYVTGMTTSANFPTANQLQGDAGGTDAFVAKLNPAGSALVYATYLGGSGTDAGQGIAVDGAGNAYVTGETSSGDFPTANALQAVFGGSTDAFVAKLSPSGSALVYSTYLGGSQADVADAVTVDTPGNAYVTGSTTSGDFPTVNPIQATHGGNDDAFLAKLNPAGSALVYSTYLGGDALDMGSGVAVDPAGNAYLTGSTISANFPTANALDPTHGGLRDAFALKVNPAGSALMYSTYLGGSFTDEGLDIATDGAGNAYVTGYSGSVDFPTVNAFQAANAGFDAFVAKLNPGGSALAYSTFLGGGAIAFAIAVDGAGNAYVTGATSSSAETFPETPGVFQPVAGGDQDAFVAKIADVAPAFTRTITGDLLGPVTVNAGERVLITSARVVGPVTVNPGGALTVVNSRITRGITATAPSFFSLCGTEVSAPTPGGTALSVTGATVLIRVGDPATGCAGNRFAGQVVLSGNAAVTFGANTVSHNATLDNNGPGNTVVKANTVFGTLGCAGNNPPPTNAGQANTAGAKTGQCAGL